MDINKPRQNFPSIKCIMGNWVYYITYMTFSDVAHWIKRNDEVHRSVQLSDMIQRELKGSKTVKNIADYLLNQQERFFNSIVVGVYGGSPQWYPIELSPRPMLEAPELDEDSASSVGVLMLNGKEDLFAIDGQHRVEGIKKALEINSNLGNEELSVIFVAHRTDDKGKTRTRRLFSTLNRHAKPVSKGEIVALDEDDAFAIVTRRLVEEHPLLSSGFVWFGKATPLPISDKRSLTSILALYEIVQTIYIPAKANLTIEQKQEINEMKLRRPSDQVLDQIYKSVEEYWNILSTKIPEYRILFQTDPDEEIAGKYRTSEGGHLLFRPMGQKAFAQATRVLIDRHIPIDKAVEMLSLAPMQLNQAPWRYVLWNPATNRMNTKISRPLPESILLHFVNHPPRIADYNVLEQYRKALDDNNALLPF